MRGNCARCSDRLEQVENATLYASVRRRSSTLLFSPFFITPFYVLIFQRLPHSFHLSTPLQRSVLPPLSTPYVDSGQTLESPRTQEFVMWITAQICTIWQGILYWRR
jgi:hypothetical protein